MKTFNEWWQREGLEHRGDRISLALDAWSAAMRASGRCERDGHVWVGVGDEGKVVCDDCGTQKSARTSTWSAQK